MVSRGLLQVDVTLYAGRVPSAVLREAGAQPESEVETQQHEWGENA